MKKSLLALAVFGAFSGAAMAQSSVQLYGIIDLGVTHFSGLAPANGASGNTTVSSTGLSSGVQSGSRIGVKGVEDLGGGLSAFFQAETGFCAAGTNQDLKAGAAQQGYCTGGGFMGRTSIVGLKGGFGTVAAGRMYTQAFNNEAGVDPFGWGLTGDIGNTSLVGQYGLARANQTIAYMTPDLSGFSGVAAYSFAPGAASTIPSVTAAGTSNVSRAWTLNGQYGNGPILAGVNYSRVTNLFSAPTSTIADGALKAFQVYGAYDFGVAKISGIYEQAKQDYYNGNNKFFMLGATVPVGPGAILASYSQGKNTLVQQGATGAGAGKVKQYALGYTYSLSKRTNLYTSYAHISNDAAVAGGISGTNFAVGSATDSFTGVNGQSSSGFALGIRHQF